MHSPGAGSTMTDLACSDIRSPESAQVVNFSPVITQQSQAVFAIS